MHAYRIFSIKMKLKQVPCPDKSVRSYLGQIDIYTCTIKISKSVGHVSMYSMYVGVYGYAFRHALSYGAETWQWVRGWAHEV